MIENTMINEKWEVKVKCFLDMLGLAAKKAEVKGKKRNVEEDSEKKTAQRQVQISLQKLKRAKRKLKFKCENMPVSVIVNNIKDDILKLRLISLISDKIRRRGS